MKNLLIHNNNIAFKNSFEEHIKFDNYTSTLKEIQKIDFEIIYIKDNLSSNYLELYGVILAYHIRLSEELEDKRFLPIVIISDLDGFTLNKLEPMARILFTQNVFIIKNSKKDFDEFQKKKLNLLPFNQDKFINSIEIESPENSTNHSIANEWAIDRWAKFVNAKSDIIRKNIDKLYNMLYIKYLLAKNPIENSKSLGFKRAKLSGEILYIDDEWDKGWSDIFDKYFEHTNITFEPFEYDFKDKNIYSIRAEIRNKIDEYNPDLVLLDLRLTKNDQIDKNREDISKYSGIEILKDIKEINQGIQVLMLTATSKSLILDKLYQYDIVGYIKKEHPSDKNIKIKENFNKLETLIDKGLEKKYLKEIWTIQNSILKLDLFEKDDDYFDKIKFEVDTIFEILNSNIENKIKFTLITIFKVFEILTNKYFKGDSKIGAYGKITSIIKTFKIDIDNGKISQLVCTRNFLVHSGEIRKDCEGKDKVIKKPNQKNILTWFKMLQTILEAIDKDSK